MKTIRKIFKAILITISTILLHALGSWVDWAIFSNKYRTSNEVIYFIKTVGIGVLSTLSLAIFLTVGYIFIHTIYKSAIGESD